jgi:hypothetical protein
MASMDRLRTSASRQWQDGLNLLLGLWLIISPWVLGYATLQNATWNSWIPGVIMAVAAFSAVVAFHAWEEWVNVALGVWLIVSPWLLGYGTLDVPATWNHIIVGVVAGGLALWSAVDKTHGQVATH